MVAVVLHHESEPPESPASSYTRTSRTSGQSQNTNSTLPTTYSQERPGLERGETCDARVQSKWRPSHTGPYLRQGESFDRSVSPSISNGSVNEQGDGGEVESHEQYEAFQEDVLPATSADFAELFPSSRLISIRHDDTTMDGNVNLRLDTRVELPSGRKRDMTLFHLRMYDLKGRSFSLRRYCRDSGREICHSGRKEQKHPLLLRRPTLPRSLSNAFAGMKAKSDLGVSGTSPKSLNRIDSGYDSCDDDGEEDEIEEKVEEAPAKPNAIMDPDLINIEFSNYAHIDIRRKGLKNAKRYDFEYWGIQYSWRRVVRKLDDFKEVSYHLVEHSTGNIIAHVVPTALDKLNASDEIEKGGWVPPCSMWLSDDKLYHRVSDVSDVIVATGIMALVDDCIRRRFQSKQKRQLIMAAPANLNSTGDVHYTGRKSVIDETMRSPQSLQSLG